MPLLQKSGISGIMRNVCINDVRNVCVAVFVGRKDTHGIPILVYERAGLVFRGSATCAVRKRTPTPSPTVSYIIGAISSIDAPRACPAKAAGKFGEASSSTGAVQHLRHAVHVLRASVTCAPCKRTPPTSPTVSDIIGTNSSIDAPRACAAKVATRFGKSFSSTGAVQHVRHARHVLRASATCAACKRTSTTSPTVSYIIGTNSSIVAPRACAAQAARKFEGISV